MKLILKIVDNICLKVVKKDHLLECLKILIIHIETRNIANLEPTAMEGGRVTLGAERGI